jgi:thiamine biosynthesis lipoprotein
MLVGCFALAAAAGVCRGAVAGETPTFVGPAMGTTYRVVLAAPLERLAPGEVHREIEDVLARIDRAASTWRDDSDASRFNRAAAGEWLEVADDLVEVIEIARRVHDASQGAFDVTVRAHGTDTTAPPASAVLRPGMACIETGPTSIRKTRAGVAIDLGGIGPGYAVDRIGARLVALGSRAHLVELGGEVRGWGRAAGGGAWRVRVTDGRAEGPRVIELADGAAVAASTLRPGRSPLDPRTGRPVAGAAHTLLVRAGACDRPDACAWADAWAVAAIVLGLPADADGLVTAPPAPSTPAARPAATRAGP